jgi:hypothetical protein
MLRPDIPLTAPPPPRLSFSLPPKKSKYRKTGIRKNLAFIQAGLPFDE